MRHCGIPESFENGIKRQKEAFLRPIWPSKHPLRALKRTANRGKSLLLNDLTRKKANTPHPLPLCNPVEIPRSAGPCCRQPTDFRAAIREEIAL